ncbi:MAG: FAD:protein FMN transferase [Candidatus Altimarinota bacterium]
MKKFEFTFKALGTICTIVVVGESKNGLTPLINESYKKIVAFENEFSRFKNDSTLSILNEKKECEVSDEFLSLIQKSREVYTLTSGYFNPLMNANKIGYSHSFDTQIFEKKEVVENLSFQNVKNYGNLIKLDENMNLDFASIAKGYLAEKISQFLRGKGWKNNLVNLGGDIYISGLNLEGEKWKVAIDSPFGDVTPIETILLTNMSISTSGSYLRKWEIQGEKYHHLRNPFSQKLETELVSVSIIHPFGYMTDGLATACFAMGKEKAISFLEENNISYLFVLQNGEILKNIK